MHRCPKLKSREALNAGTYANPPKKKHKTANINNEREALNKDADSKLVRRTVIHFAQNRLSPKPLNLSFLNPKHPVLVQAQDLIIMDGQYHLCTYQDSEVSA